MGVDFVIMNTHNVLQFFLSQGDGVRDILTVSSNDGSKAEEDVSSNPQVYSTRKRPHPQ